MINLRFLGNQPVAVLGLGKTGLATIHALQASNVPYLAWDDNAVSREQAVAQNIQITAFNQNNLQNCQALVWSPGIPHTLPQPHPIAALAKQLNLPLITDLDLLYRAQPQAKYIGITGTNGKSTTTALIAHILKSAGEAIEVGGNLGYPALSLTPLGADGIYVLELSSYQTELMQDLRCDIAVWLNLTPDHTERHGDLAQYAKAKARIFRPRTEQSLAIIGTDDPFSMTQIHALTATQRRVVALYISVEASEETLKSLIVPHVQFSPGRGVVDSRPFDFANNQNLLGMHNAQNVAAAIAVCRELQVADDKIEQGIQSYFGLPHRQQYVARHNQVQFINDSKGTNPEATAKALACYERIYWIIGGRPTSDGLNGLEKFTQRIQHAFIIGEASADFAQWCAAQNLPYSLCETLDRAVPAAAQVAFSDPVASTILLSPACKSWDQFTSYEARGDLFIELAKQAISAS